MADAAPAELRARVLDRIDDDEVVRLAAGIPCCLYGPGGGYTDYHDVHVDLEDLFLCTRVLALTALDATR